MQGEIVRAWEEGGFAYLAVRVVENGRNTEYLGSVPASELAGKTAGQKKTVLAAAVKAARAAVLRAEADLGLTGTVTL